MKVGIFSMDEKLVQILTHTINEYLTHRFLASEVTVFPNLKNFLNSHTEFDILFVDDNFEKRSSNETARLIRTRDTQVAIVLLSSNPDKVYDSFAVKAHRFLLKPLTQSMIFEAIDSYRKDVFAYRIIIAKIDSTFKSYSSEEIFYIEASGKGCVLHTKKGALASVTPFSQILEQLPDEYFYACHRSFAVNMKYIRELTPTEVSLTDGTFLPISRRRKMDFFMAFNQFIKGHTFN